jgi:hypothetical protein
MVVGFRDLCTPASVYLGISIIALIVMILQNFGNTHSYCLGTYECDVSNIYIVFIIKILYILLWTWILNLVCSYGGSQIAWFLVLLPFLIFFILIAAMMVPAWTH